MGECSKHGLFILLEKLLVGKWLMLVPNVLPLLRHQILNNCSITLFHVSV